VSNAADDSLYGWAWVALCLALAIHVVDEALTGFLSVYNPAVKALRQRWRFLPLPTFSFKVWLGGLIVAVIFLFALSPFAFAVAKWLAPLAYFFAAFMIINGLQHIAASVYMRRLMPGTYSAPLLLICATYLLVHIR
jgi:predicted tellurium resistance membrane protein TerC